jgi:cytochrome c peroxidase
MDYAGALGTEEAEEAADAGCLFHKLIAKTNIVMQLLRPTTLIPLLVAFAVLRAGSVLAAPPKVPSLPAQATGYVQYALTNFPPQYQNGPDALDNTPADNLLTDAGATLGRALFYDKRLSHDNSTACASCHKQSKGFSDENQFSAGINGQLTTRHSMGLTNVVFYASGAMFWDERASSIEDQALKPIQSPTEMGSTLPEVVTKLSQTTFYPTLFQAAFGTPEITPDRIAKATAQFERSMISYNSKYDAYLNGQATLTPAESAGEQLFNNSARCSACHTTTAQVGDVTHNIGLDATVTDPGAGVGRFKTPSLRNVAVRGRYMHDGRFSSLEEVVQFYSTQVQDTPLLDGRLRDPVQLNLTSDQINDIVAFLNTLTDNSFLTNQLFSDPFVTLPGDYNGDGVVDSADYIVWRKNVGDTTSLVADGNNDHHTDNLDYAVWRQNLGKTWQDLAYGSGGGLSSPSVPEPGGAVLVALASLCTLARRRRGRRTS